MGYDLDRYYTQEFYSTNLDEGLRHGRWFVPLIMRIFDPRSVMDIGCGMGHFVEGFAKLGIRTIGLEGSNFAVKNAVHSTVCYWDLRNPLAPDTLSGYDLAICIEVAEHLEPEFAGTLIDTLTRCPTVIMTAAVPGQGGLQHVNEQEWSYWARMFADRGFSLDKAVVDRMMRGIEEARDSGEHVAGWWKNLLVFRKDDAQN